MEWLDKLITSVDWAVALVFTHFFAIVVFLLALVIFSRVLEEKRKPSNFFAWFLLILIIPYLGIPLYIIFGGRKIRKRTESKEHFLPSGVESYPSCSLEMEHAHWPQFPPSIPGNSVSFLENGEEMFRRLCIGIADARQSIRLATYILGDDEVGRDLVSRLAHKAAQGVEVKLLLDGLGSFGRSRKMCGPLRKAGGEVAYFLPVFPLQMHWSANLRNHRKLAIFDFETAIVGGQNLDTRFIGPEPSEDRFDDCSIEIQGPAVAELSRLFASDWGFACNRPTSEFLQKGFRCPLPHGDSPIQVVASGPDVPKDQLYEKILTIIQEAQNEILIVTPYFIPDEVIYRSLMVKAHAGKQVTLIIPLRSNHTLVDNARNVYLRELQDAGVSVLGYKPRMLHAKLIWVDGKVALIGSANVDQRSLFLNYEIGLFLYKDQDLERIERWIRLLKLDCDEIRLPARSHLSMRKKLIEDLAYLAAPLL
jgi:cardiolipin synthase